MTMNTLELKHIAPYLPHDVKVYHFDGNREEEQICNIEQITKEEIVIANHEHEYCFEIKDTQLILRPLSDLTKPCLEGGLIPIVELAKIAFKKSNYIALMDGNNCLVGFNTESHSYLFSYSKSHGSFSVMNLFYSGSKWRPERDTFCSNQLQLFEKLFEWHFDVYGLIPQNIAIDINTLKNEQTNN